MEICIKNQTLTEAVYLVDEKFYLHIQYSDSSGCWDITLFDQQTLKNLDGGQIDAPEESIEKVCDAFLLQYRLSHTVIERLPDDQAIRLLDAIVEQAENSRSFLIEGDRVLISGDSAALGIEDYNVRVDSYGTVVVTPTIGAAKVLVCIDSVDGDRNVSALVNAAKIKRT